MVPLIVVAVAGIVVAGFLPGRAAADRLPESAPAAPACTRERDIAWTGIAGRR